MASVGPFGLRSGPNGAKRPMQRHSIARFVIVCGLAQAGYARAETAPSQPPASVPASPLTPVLDPASAAVVAPAAQSRAEVYDTRITLRTGGPIYGRVLDNLPTGLLVRK